MILTEKIQVTTVGADGSALGNKSSGHPVNGEVVAIYVDWSASAPGTDRIVITCESDDNHPAITLYDKTASATDDWVYPSVQLTDTAGTGKAFYVPISVSGTINAAVTLSNALAVAATVYVYVRER